MQKNVFSNRLQSYKSTSCFLLNMTFINFETILLQLLFCLCDNRHVGFGFSSFRWRGASWAERSEKKELIAINLDECHYNKRSFSHSFAMSVKSAKRSLTCMIRQLKMTSYLISTIGLFYIINNEKELHHILNLPFTHQGPFTNVSSESKNENWPVTAPATDKRSEKRGGTTRMNGK